MSSSDDAPIGRVLTRREALGVLGVSGVALLAAGRIPASRSARGSSPLPACVVRPEQTEGPYFVDERLERSDIRSDPSDGTVKPGAPLALTIAIARIAGTTCAPLVGAQVDLWQCDAEGSYSDVADISDASLSTVGRKFLRGYQRTDDQGMVRFLTIYPGWYVQRAVHVHFKVRTDPASSQGYAFTSQLYFDDSTTDRVQALAPYASRGERRIRNGDDRIFKAQQGEQLVLATVSGPSGYSARFDMGWQVG